MISLFKILLGLFVIFIGVCLLWRFSSERYSLPCPAWLGWMIEMENPFTEVNRTPFILNHLKINPGMSVLDAGCGPGRVTPSLAQAVGPQGKVLALDIQQEMLTKVREKVKTLDLKNVFYLQTGLGNGKLDQDAFDRAILVTVLGEIPDQVSAMKELYRALKPGGILLITEIIFDPHFQRCKKVVHLANSTGFRKKEFFGGRLAYTITFEKPL